MCIDDVWYFIESNENGVEIVHDEVRRLEFSRAPNISPFIIIVSYY